MTLNQHDGGLSLHWLDCSFEIAIYDDQHESYRFFDGETAICHWPHALGKPSDLAFLAKISEG